MRARRLVLVVNGLDAQGLAEVLASLDAALCVVEQEFLRDEPFNAAFAAQILARHGPCDGLLLAPAFAHGAVGATLDDVPDVLTSSFIFLKAALASFEERAVAGRVFALLPGDAAMGDPSHVVNSAIAGAMLSLFRTVALELRQTPVTVNTLMYSPCSGGQNPARQAVHEPEGLATLISSLLGTDARSINGQEIYACAGADVGRLHP